MEASTPQSNIFSRKVLIGSMVGVACSIVIVLIMFSREERAVSPVQEKKEDQILLAVKERGSATVWVSLPAGAEKILAGEEGVVEVRFDTKGQGISVMRVVLVYDPVVMEVRGVEGAGSSLPMEAAVPGALTPGRVEIVRFITNQDKDLQYRGFIGAGLLASVRIMPHATGMLKIALDVKETEYVPFQTGKEFAFSEMKDGIFEIR